MSKKWIDSRCTGNRREFVWEMGAGFGGVALTSMLSDDGFFAKHAYGETAPTI